ncbi:MAG: hypothetical protein A3G39_09155 [Deltaproteobacteria bacterium RIFCSPLOWO2_12_FULL_43_16]|nr:MAG: hypothetical protein A2Z89_05440 [Deltaproteobacteria bacterium GWA2_43_19]OGQ12570.1 MAG: hypothetical protein A3D30_10580 [Deltaproteobacteria bacterium RIFCSPHIGHO2_02_FULL_43_33]OGQ56842.1 MAG: hypothetical protein A3G39_09155 [Deltaproteobacteria bacterium RIFCSPLOWO2_12_FULL_43_16]HBR17985.1 TIGR03960 family B12-binding radical SAM protein [Deltaproteobacteria bacterium]
MAEVNIKNYLALVSRPSRYINGEVNSIKKDLSHIQLKIGLAFPDVYEVGMSHLGMQILYQILNSRDNIACERVFSPWVDMEKLLREKNIPLTTLESGIPLNKLDILGFSIQYELSYTNILTILNLGNIPLYSKDRDETHPLIIGGGPIAFNPEPIADFFDAFVLGDGEEVVLEIADVVIEWKKERGKRKDLLKRLAKIEGMYVPSFFDVAYNQDGTVKKITPLLNGYEGVKKRIVSDINKLPLPIKPVVPFPQIVHDHLTVEINRGCTRGCRFCQAGMIYRPNRERSPENIMKLVEEALKNTGYDEVSFLSLSTGDYSCIQDVLINFMDRFADKKVAVSLPSLRVGTLSPQLIAEIKRVRKTGFTMAPEAGSERLRNVINKGIEEDALIETAENVFEMGWKAIKLYYMIGLPTETLNDVRGIVELSNRVQETGKRLGFRPTINVSVSQFIPKPHTPFQWEPQIQLEESLERQTFLRQELKKRRLDFKWHDARMSFLEGVFARGDRRLSKVVKAAYGAGCRFDSWGDHFRFDIWQQIFKDNGVNPEFYTYRRRDRDEIFPWDHLNARVDKEFLYKEYERSVMTEQTSDCKTDKCSICGICDHKVIKNVSFYEKSEVRGKRLEARNPPTSNLQPPTFKTRLTFSKTGAMKYLGHLELVTLFSRAIRRAEIPITYSAGFHPLPKMVFSPPLSVGIESVAEYVDLELRGHMKPQAVLERLNSTLSEGIKILEAIELPTRPDFVVKIPQEATYLIFLENLKNGNKLDELINGLMRSDEIIIHQEREGKQRSIDIRPLIKNLSLIDTATIRLTIDRGEKGSVKPNEVIARLLGLSHNDSRLISILKTKGHYETLRQ